MNKNVALTSLAWGIFFVWIGLSCIASEYYNVSMGAYIALGVGVILIGLNAARALLKLKPSKFSLFIGIIALAFGGASAAGFELPLWQTILVLIGLFIIAEAATSLARSK
ncbi:MAG: hypothetical protein QXG58_03915 [Candidatus Bathyarchaeia archaeon]